MTIVNGVYQQSDHWEAMFFSIDNLNKSVIIGNVCRPSRELKEALTYFTNKLNRAIQQKDVKGKKMILSEDFNINLTKLNKNMYGNFFDVLTSYSLVLNITCQTRITTTSATLIDNIFANSLMEIVSSGMISNKSISDHYI